MTEVASTTGALPDPSTIPIKALRLGTRNLISSLLNPPKIIPNDNGLPRDWRGLAHLIGLKAEKIPVIACDSDPSARVISIWQKQENSLGTIKQLQDFLGELDRFDIVDDIADMIVKDILYFINEPEKIKSVLPISDDADKHILTIDDVNRIHQGLDTQTYDAFVVFADEDIDFATELIEIMEKQYGLKLCVKERDLVAGLHFEHKAIIELISERCNRLIVIISPAYLKSSANKFVVNYAQALGIEQGKRKIIPCLYEPCELPQELRHTFMLKYQKSGKLYNFWDRLQDSIKAPVLQPSPRLNNTQRLVSPVLKPNYAEKSPELKPSLAQSNKNGLKPKKEGVTFGSMSNLKVIESKSTVRSASVNELSTESASVTMDTNPVETKKEKNKHNFFKKWIKHKDENKKSCNGIEKKKKSWLKTKIMF